MNLVLAVLAANVAAVYFTIAAVAVPRIGLCNVAGVYHRLFRFRLSAGIANAPSDTTDPQALLTIA